MGRARIREVDDIHPILRANPFLIEDGARLVRGEAFLKEDSLKRIEIALEDRNGLPLYVEVKWNGFSQKQVDEYLSLLRQRYAEKPFRLMWFVPEDMVPEITDTRIEIKGFSRASFEELLAIRDEARAVLSSVHQALTNQVTVPKGLMYGEEIVFPNIISACYFEGRVETEKGTRQIGLRKQAIGRSLDTVRCVCECPHSSLLPELTAILVYELLFSPYFFEHRGEGTVDSHGIHGHLAARKTSGYYRPIAHAVEDMSPSLTGFVQERAPRIRTLYGSNPSRCDILYRVLLDAPKDIYDQSLIVLRKLLSHLIAAFALIPTTPVPRIHHTRANQWVDNSVVAHGYENDFAKRLVEIAVLKRELLPVSGVGIMSVLTMNLREGKRVFARTPVQNLQLNREETLVRELFQGE